jgi:hypothetical protein
MLAVLAAAHMAAPPQPPQLLLAIAAVTAASVALTVGLTAVAYDAASGCALAAWCLSVGAAAVALFQSPAVAWLPEGGGLPLSLVGLRTLAAALCLLCTAGCLHAHGARCWPLLLCNYLATLGLLSLVSGARGRGWAWALGAAARSLVTCVAIPLVAIRAMDARAAAARACAPEGAWRAAVDGDAGAERGGKALAAAESSRKRSSASE